MSFKSVIDDSPVLDAAIKYYWGYMYGLARDFMIPHLEERNIPIKGSAIIEIGCAEGGNLCAMAEVGAKELVGTDIAENRLDNARKIASILKVDITYSSHDIIGQPPRPEWVSHFDVAFLRDVIEHLDDTVVALKNIKTV